MVAAQVQRAGDGFLVHYEQSTADLMWVKTVRCADTTIAVSMPKDGGWNSRNPGVLVWRTPPAPLTSPDQQVPLASHVPYRPAPQTGLRSLA